MGDGTVAAGYVVFAVNPLQAARYRDRHAVSGAKSDTGDGHILADMVRTDAHQLRPVAADTEEAQAVKVVARARKTLISERNRKVTWPQCQLRDFFSPALDAYGGLGLDSADVLELLTKSPDPAAAAKLTTAQVSAALKRAHRRHVADKTAVIRAALRAPQLAQPASVTTASAAVVRALAAVIVTLNQQIAALEKQVEAHFLVHPDAEIVLSQPGLGRILAPGCSVSSATTRHGMPAPKPARTTRPPARSPASQARGKPSWPGTCTTTGSATHSAGRPTQP